LRLISQALPSQTKAQAFCVVIPIYASRQTRGDVGRRVAFGFGATEVETFGPGCQWVVYTVRHAQLAHLRVAGASGEDAGDFERGLDGGHDLPVIADFQAAGCIDSAFLFSRTGVSTWDCRRQATRIDGGTLIAGHLHAVSPGRVSIAGPLGIAIGDARLFNVTTGLASRAESLALTPWRRISYACVKRRAGIFPDA